MDIFSPHILFFLESVMFLTVILMHLLKKNSYMVVLYAVQSVAVIAALFGVLSGEPTALLIFALLSVFLVKVIIAPYFFIRLIHKHGLTFTASTHLNTPGTLVALTLLSVLSYSYLGNSLSILMPENGQALSLALAFIIISIFLIINRKGALSQMIGVLSLENGIVSFATLAGLEQSPVLQLGLVFDIFLWVIIATVFVSMIFEKFGSLDVSAMAHLKEE